MTAYWQRYTLFLCLSIFHLWLCGCAGPFGGGFSFLPEQRNLLPQAEQLRHRIPATVPRELEEKVQQAYIVEPGDVLYVQPSDLDSPLRLPGDQSILLDGTISLGKFGRMPVAGKSLVTIEREVEAKIKDMDTEFKGTITARVVSRNSKVYYVLGEVNSPGSFPLDGRESVLDGLIQAGGLTKRAASSRVILVRPSLPNQPRSVFPVCYQQIVQLGDTTTNYQLAPGDRIYVPSKTIWEEFLGHEKGSGPCPTGHEHKHYHNSPNASWSSEL